ncbi:MAG: hypothetical protein M1818_003303 [Claussenomyces sp. TS43310]|nr:MAG: hypothetical protein M1818_003303 [Claussenomyces sp. TS43310]
MALQASISKITPPESTINSPPTPPLTDTKPAARVARIRRALRGCQNGVPPRSPWTVYNLSSEEYEELLDRLQHDELLNGFVVDKVR